MSATAQLLPDGTPTGLYDSEGLPINVGDLLKIVVTCNEEMHGKWSAYRVKLQGIVPILSYEFSETGKQLPEGYLACCLSDKYSTKNFVFACNRDRLRPMETMTIMERRRA